MPPKGYKIFNEMIFFLKSKEIISNSLRDTTLTYTANWNYPTNVKVGQGRISELAELCTKMGMQSPLLITDPGLAALPMVEKVVKDVQEIIEKRRSVKNPQF